MSGHHERPRRHGPRGPRANRSMPIDAVWEEGPRTEAWNELWRRLLAAVVEDGEKEETCESDAADGDVSTDPG